MTRFEYINALRQALEGLPSDVVVATVSEYERRIYEESAAGRSEEEIIADLGDPQAVAAERRARFQLNAFKQHKTTTNFFRVCFSLIGLMIFNLFLLIPTIVYSALVFAAYCASLACYVGGIALVAISLAGVGEVATSNASLDTSVPHVQIAAKDNSVKVEIGKDGKAVANSVAANVSTSTSTSTSASASASATATASAAAPASSNVASTKASASSTGDATVTVKPNDIRISDGTHKIRISGDDNDDDDDVAFEDDDHGLRIGMPGVRVYNSEDSGRLLFMGADALHASRPAEFFIGLGMILGGIIAFLLCLAISRYSIIGILRLVQMEFAVLKNA